MSSVQRHGRSAFTEPCLVPGNLIFNASAIFVTLLKAKRILECVVALQVERLTLTAKKLAARIWLRTWGGNFKCIQFNMQMSLSASRDQAQFPAQHMWRPQTVCVSISGSVYMGVHINKHKWQAKKMSAKPCGRCRCCCCQRRSRCCCCCCHIFSRCSGWQRP